MNEMFLAKASDGMNDEGIHNVFINICLLMSYSLSFASVSCTYNVQGNVRVMSRVLGCKQYTNLINLCLDPDRGGGY